MIDVRFKQVDSTKLDDQPISPGTLWFCPDTGDMWLDTPGSAGYDTRVKYSPKPGDVIPGMDGAGSIGTSPKYARQDHIHPSDTSRVPTTRTINGKVLNNDITLTAEDVGALDESTVIPAASLSIPNMDGVGNSGSEDSWARGDHTHPTDTSRVPITRTVNGKALTTNITLDASDVGALPTDTTIPIAAITDPIMDGVASAGTAKKWARGDHVHPTDTSRAAVDHTHGNITSTGDITSTAPIQSGDRLVINDESEGVITNSSLVFGTDTSKYLRNDGTWGTPGGGAGGGDVNQNAFSNIQVGDATISANVETDTLKLVAGPNVTLVPDVNQNKLTISSIDTTYDAATSTPIMDGSANVGYSDKYAREDHIHPSDTSKVPVSRTINGKSLDTDILLTAEDVGAISDSVFVPSVGSDVPLMDDVGSAGTSTNYSREDHVHPTDTSRVPTSRTINNKALSSDITLTAEDVGALPSSTAIPEMATAVPIVDGIGAVGSSIKYAKEDHVHPTDTSRAAANHNHDYSASNHSHGNITNSGTITDTDTIGTGDRLVIATDPNGTVTTSDITFGHDSTKFLSNAGTWVTPPSSGGSGGEMNQNAFSNIRVGSTTLAADSTTDTFIIAAGDNITLTPDEANDKLTISSSYVNTDTKNTAGSTNNTSRLYLIGATSQAENPQTYSRNTVYVGADGDLYSNGTPVVNLSDPQNLTNKTYEGYTLGDASAKGVDTTISSGSTSTKLPTTAAVIQYINDNMPSPGEMNQNAFSNVIVGTTTIAADTKTDSITLVAGDNVTLSPNAADDTITISAVDSVYSPAIGYPPMDGIPTAGTSNRYAREDHVHPIDTSRAAANHTHEGSVTSASNVGSGVKPIFISSNVATASSSTVGSANNPIYLSNGTLTAGNTFVPNTGGTFTGAINVNQSNGTESSIGTSVITVGNATASGTAGNSEGDIRIYGSGSNYAHIKTASVTGTRLYTLEDSSGGVVKHTVGTAIGSDSEPVYVNSTGMVVKCTNVNAATSDYATAAGTSEKIGSATIGSGANPIYINNGVPTASTTTLGAADTPVYLNNGTLTKCTAYGSATVDRSNYLGTKTVGGVLNPIYLDNGSPKASNASLGSTSQPVYLSNGTFKACTSYSNISVSKVGTSDIGSGVKPIYLSAGTPTASSSSVGSGTKPIYLSSGTLTESSSTVGSATGPVYLKSGVITACTTYDNATVGVAKKLGTATVGGTATPIYLSSGTATALSATVGSATQPAYLDAGKITKCTYSLNKTVPSDAKFTDTTYSTASSSSAGLMPANHYKFISELGDLVKSLDSSKTTVANGGSLSSGTFTLSADSDVVQRYLLIAGVSGADDGNMEIRIQWYGSDDASGWIERRRNSGTYGNIQAIDVVEVPKEHRLRFRAVAYNRSGSSKTIQSSIGAYAFRNKSN